MSWTALEPGEWAAEQFGSVALGDRRLNKRAVKVAEAMAADPSGSIPRQNKRWGQTKGAYRLFDHPKATFAALSQPHWQQTHLACAQTSVTLLIQDTTWLDYAAHPQTSGLGWAVGQTKKGGKGKKPVGSGLFLHSVLAVEPQADGSGRVIGLAYAKTWARTGEPIGLDQPRRSAHRHSDERESLRWKEAVEQIGSPLPSTLESSSSSPASPAPMTRYLHVGDRESDLFNLYQQTQEMNCVGFAVRVSKDRNAAAGHDTPETQTREQRKAGGRLKALCRSMPALGQKQMWLGPDGKNRTGRMATLSVSGGPVTIWSPQLDRTGHALRCWVVRVWEEHPPAGQQAVEWIILTSEPVTSLAEALRVAAYYTLRWLIEQYHQCLKSGCKVEERQLETADRLEPLIGMLSAVAVRLLQLKNNARLAPDRPATECAPKELVETLSKLIKVKASKLTVRQFTHEVAKLGGFLGRKSDGEPGWRTLWQGWQELSLIHAGYELAMRERKDVGNG